MERLENALGCVLPIAFLLLGIVQIYAAWLGIEHYWGAFAAGAIIIGSLLLRSSLAVTVGAFFGAYAVWQWPWYGAAAFAAPGLVFVTAGTGAQLLAGLFKRREA